MEFEQALNSVGIVPKIIINDGRIHHCKTTDKPHKLNGRYCYTGDFGWFKNWATMDQVQLWFANKPMTPARKREIDALLERQREQFKQDRIKAIQDMRLYWQGLPELWGGHAYLEHKGLTMLGCKGLRMDKDVLVIPMCDQKNQLMSLQKIQPNGDKRYQTNCPTKGTRLVLDRKHYVITLLSEGLATGLTLYEALPNARIIVCFDAGNLVNVAQTLNLKGLAAIAADNDWQTEARTGTNNGILKATQAAEILRCGLVYPTGIVGSDFNDMLAESPSRELGLARIKTEVMRGVKMVM